jgi:cytochrome c oxidase assembly factor CtaG
MPPGWLRPEVVLPLVLLEALQLRGILRRPAGVGERVARALAFALGLAAVAAACAGPVGRLVGGGVFSARVAQDVLLTFGAVPLGIVGLPAEWVRAALRPRGVRRVARVATRPAVAIASFHAALFAGLLPVTVGVLGHRPVLSAVAGAVLVATAVQMWTPLLVDVPELRGPALGVQLLYLFFNWLLVTLAFAVLLFDGRLPYDGALHAVLPFGFSADQDRQLGAVILGLGSHIAYLVALAALFLRWADREAATASPGHVYVRLRGGGWTDAEARRIAGLPPRPGSG